MNAHAPTADAPEGVRFRGDGYIAEAGWFGPGNRPRFGWLYRPDRPAPNGVGVVIVPPFGFEAICAARSLRHLAANLGSAGFVCVRFDLDGTGDSAGDDEEPDRLTAWQGSIHDACDLVHAAGAGRVVLIGLRLGAALAASIAEARDDITGYIAINGVVRGRDFLREARVLQAAMALRPPPHPSKDDGSQEINGFVVTAETRTHLGDLDLNQHHAPPAARVLLIERDDMPERTRWPKHLRSLGVEVGVQRLSGLATMLDLPHLTRVPDAVLDACTAWVRRIAGAVHAAPPNASPPDAVMRPHARIGSGPAAVIEHAVWIDDTLFGILSQPESRAAGDGIVLLNAGAVNHIGPNRMYVKWARRWASRGKSVLRVDLSGIGDSPTRAGANENQVYNPHGITDTIRIATWLEQRVGGPVLACGACSGAYHALRAALATDAIEALALVNPGALQQVGSLANEVTELNGDSYYNNQLKSGRGLRKLLSGKVAPRKLARVAWWYLSTYANRYARELRRKLGWPVRHDLGPELQSLAQRGTRISCVFSADDQSRARLSVQAGSVAKRLVRQGHIHVQVIDGPDHTFTPRWTQDKLGEAMDTLAFLSERRHDGTGSRRAS